MANVSATSMKHCDRGHPQDAINQGYNPDGSPFCKACRREDAWKNRAKKSERPQD